MQQALKSKEPALVNRKCELFFHDNARPGVALVVRDTIRLLGKETLWHNTMELAPTDYHLPFSSTKFRGLSGRFLIIRVVIWAMYFSFIQCIEVVPIKIILQGSL